ncbi:MAG: hypothetical protein QM651_10985 [Rhodoblastus sp.]
MISLSVWFGQRLCASAGIGRRKNLLRSTCETAKWPRGLPARLVGLFSPYAKKIACKPPVHRECPTILQRISHFIV